MEFSADLFDRESAQTLASRYVRLLAAVVADPDLRVDQVEVLEAAERTWLLEDVNRTQRPVQQATLAELFQAQALRTPQAVAVECASDTVTYQELNERANQLARYLLNYGVRPGSVVGVALPRSVSWLVAMLAVVKTGAAYCPIDAALPTQRIQFVLQDAAPSVVLTVSANAPAMTDVTDERLLLLDDPTVKAALSSTPTDDLATNERGGQLLLDHTAYVIYTSGSTGQPKGVAVTHRGLASMITEHVERMQISTGDRLLQLVSPSFDVSMAEVGQTLGSGATLVIAQAAHEAGGDELAAVLNDLTITHAMIPAALLTTVPTEAVSTLRSVGTGGEAISADLASRWASAGIRLINGYGPTESTVAVTMSTPARVGEQPHIGTPIANSQVYVLDEALQPLPTGAVGELYLTGDGLARGYIHQPALTAERFIACPYAPPGTRMYRTGDRARWTRNGVLEFIGRTDDQIKIRGFRIELAEIETAIHSFPTVDQAAVIVREDRPNDRRLVAYVVATTGHTIDTTALRTHLTTQLPNYMVPTATVILNELPRSTNTKIDRRALPAPDYTTHTQGRPPRNPREEILCTLFAEVLGLNHITIDDNFFNLGG
ncbi:amino acid adenylation domain-containing protein, partial [Pilimelia columellifera]|uniref:non-ribosomal peptide synthetase n=1 Tax=Pilimelia columellifera TaxID=706574 RepID=UPI0031D6BB3C